MLVEFIFTPGSIRATHPTIIDVDIAILALEGRIGQVAGFPFASGAFGANLLQQVIDDSQSIRQIHPRKLLLSNLVLKLYLFTISRAAQNVINVHTIAPLFSKS